MKKVTILIGGILFVLILSLLTSCNWLESNIPETPSQVKIDGLTGRIYVIDGCDYYKFGRIDQSWGTHSGTCKNPIHRQNKAIMKEYDESGKLLRSEMIDSIIITPKEITLWSNGIKK